MPQGPATSARDNIVKHYGSPDFIGVVKMPKGLSQSALTHKSQELQTRLITVINTHPGYDLKA